LFAGRPQPGYVVALIVRAVNCAHPSFSPLVHGHPLPLSCPCSSLRGTLAQRRGDHSRSHSPRGDIFFGTHFRGVRRRQVRDQFVLVGVWDPLPMLRPPRLESDISLPQRAQPIYFWSFSAYSIESSHSSNTPSRRTRSWTLQLVRVPFILYHRPYSTPWCRE